MPHRFAVLLLAVCCALGADAEEGFWPFDMVPKESIARRFEFTPSDAWLEKTPIYLVTDPHIAVVGALALAKAA